MNKYIPTERTDNEPEIWKDIKGYEGYYQVSNIGRVKTVKTETIKKPHISNKYFSVGLSKCGIHKIYRIHRLVAEAFIKNKYNKSTINHIDGDNFNNRIENLEWMTLRENKEHAKNMFKNTIAPYRARYVHINQNGTRKYYNCINEVVRKFGIKKYQLFNWIKYNSCPEGGIWKRWEPIYE